MHRWLPRAALLACAFWCLSSARATAQDEKVIELTPAKLDRDRLVGGVLQPSVENYNKDAKTKSDAVNLSKHVGELKKAAEAATYEYRDKKPAVRFDGSKLGAVPEPDRKAVEEGLRKWLRYALEKQVLLQGDSPGVRYRRMSDADIADVVNSLSVTWPGGDVDIPPDLAKRIKLLMTRLAGAEAELKKAVEEVQKGRRSIQVLTEQVTRLEARLKQVEGAGGGSGGGTGTGEWRLVHQAWLGCAGQCYVVPAWIYVQPRARASAPPAAANDQVRLASANGTSEGKHKVALTNTGAALRKRLAPLDVAGLTVNDAELLFCRGVRSYWNGQHSESLQRLEAATKIADNDARYWYFRSLSERAAGETTAAETSLRRAAKLHVQGLPRADVIGLALERVQGEERSRFARAVEAARTARD